MKSLTQCGATDSYNKLNCHMYSCRLNFIYENLVQREFSTIKLEVPQNNKCRKINQLMLIKFIAQVNKHTMLNII